MNRHFAKLGDVWKHLPLAEMLSIRRPAQYWETHAGSASYPLTDDPLRRHGALRFLDEAPQDEDLRQCAYLRVLRDTPGTYPASPAIAIHLLGKAARYVFCDLDPISTASLKDATAGLDANIVEGDGVAALAREMRRVPDPSQVLVHIDPFLPHERATPEAATPVELAAALARDGFRLVYWYGYESLDTRAWALSEIAALAPGVALWCGDALIPSPFIFPERAGVWGCGIVLANATELEISACARFGRALERVNRADRLPDNDPPALAFCEWRS